MDISAATDHGNPDARSLVQRVRPLGYSLAVVMAFLLFLVWIAMQGQVALASFLNADTDWMKARARATVDLISYADTGNPEEYAGFGRHMKIVDAYRKAREEMLSGKLPYTAVQATLDRGGATVVEPRNTILVFTYFARAPYLKQALAWWKSADAPLAELHVIAAQLRQAYASGRAAAPEIARQRRRIMAIDAVTSRANAHFSLEVIRGAVVAGRLLYAAIFLLAAIALTLWLIMARRALARAHDDQRRLEHLARHDALTGLINRAEFERRGTAALKQAAANGSAVALLFVDLDGFKAVNDHYGHAIGDSLLKLVGARIAGQLRERDAASRLGGDEFTVLFGGVEQREDAAHLAERLSRSLSEPFQVDGYKIKLGASIGIAVADADEDDLATLMTNADAAMYVAKRNKPNAWRFYQGPMRDAVRHKVELVRDLRHALEHAEFSLVYQPIVAMRSGHTIAAEALLRWQRPEHGMLLPADFMDVATDGGLMTRIDNWVMHAACAQIRAWDAAGVPPIRISVNVSAARFGQKDLVPFVRESLAAHAVQPQRLVLEIGEQALLGLDTDTARTLRDLKALGVGVAIDNFGPAYASLSHLKLPGVVFVKVGHPFVDTLGQPGDSGEAAITHTVLAMARGLGSEVIAEGVENERQRKLLLDAGCTSGQGFLYSPTLPPEELAAQLRDHAGGPTSPTSLYAGCAGSANLPHR